MAKVLADYLVKTSQAQGQGMKRGYDYREWDVPYATRNTLYAEAAHGSLLSATISGTCTGVHSGGSTTITATEDSFGDDVKDKTIIIADTGSFTIASRTSMTVCVVTGDATCSAKAFTIAGASPLRAAYIHQRELVEHRVGIPGRSTIRAWYRTPLWARPDDTQNIRGKVYIDRVMTKQRIIVDSDSAVVEGPTGDTDEEREGISWITVAGEPYILVPRTRFRLVCAAKSSWTPWVVELLVGKVNSDTVLGGVTAGKLLFTGVREVITIYYDDELLRQVELTFLKNTVGWNNELKAQKYQMVPIATPVIAEDGGAWGDNSKVLRPVKVDASASSRVSYALVSFAPIDAMITL